MSAVSSLSSGESLVPVTRQQFTLPMVPHQFAEEAPFLLLLLHTAHGVMDGLPTPSPHSPFALSTDAGISPLASILMLSPPQPLEEKAKSLTYTISVKVTRQKKNPTPAQQTNPLPSVSRLLLLEICSFMCLVASAFSEETGACGVLLSGWLA